VDYNARSPRSAPLGYDPTIGRFIQPDTLAAGTGNSQGLNRYSYVDNDPINNIDPTGHNPCDQNDPGYNPQNCESNGPGVTSPIITPHNPNPPDSGGTDGGGSNNPSAPLQKISGPGKEFIEHAENGNRAFYDDGGLGIGNCTIGYGSLLHNGPCTGDEILQLTVNGITGLYVASRIDPSKVFLLQSWGRDPDTHQILLGMSRKDAEAMMDIELDRDADLYQSGLVIQISRIN